MSYTDNFSTNAAQTEIVVTARDPDEQETTLESLTSVSLDWVDDWEAQTVGPADRHPPPTLPDAVSIPFPVTTAICGPLTCIPGSPTTNWELSLSQFTGGGPLGGDSAEPAGPKGAYLLPRGVCAYDVDIQTTVVDALTGSIPSQLNASIEKNFFARFGAGNITTYLGAAAYINRGNLSDPVGGVVTDLMLEIDWNSSLNSAMINFNETYAFSLMNGVLNVTPSKNGENDTGAFSSTIAGSIESGLPTQIANTVYTKALATQAQPIPGNGLGSKPAACQGSGPWPSSCFITCDSTQLPSPYPPALSASNTDDSSWYATGYCSAAAGVLVDAAAVGASKYPLQGPGISAVPELMSALTTDGNSYQNVRCNFYPSYETDAKAVPVCEVVPRAKRLNILPDTVELVWFDGPDLLHIGANEYNNEAFALFLALLGAGSTTSTLCSRVPENNVVIRPFAHGLSYALTDSNSG